MPTRRNFIKTTAAGAAGALLTFPTLSQGRIIGANTRLRFAVVGVNGRGRALYAAMATVPNAEITYICDVDSRAQARAIADIQKATGKAPKGEKDFRKLLEYADIDVVAIATPEHWHAPMAIMALQAGKHVYVEKPCAHNPAEAEMLVAAQAKYNLLVQMGNQQRSGPVTQQAIQDVRDGRIGTPRFAKAWYSNNRKPIGNGAPAAVPDWLDWDLWQGPAPRRAYQDNVVHYHWHWFRHWGTGEIHNNGTHEIDIARWALGLTFPTHVTASGGRLFHQDDWEFADTQLISFQFAGGEMITWEGKSCTPQSYFDRGRGVTIHGTEGWLLLDRNSYLLYDNDNKLIAEQAEAGDTQTMDTLGGGYLTDQHMLNLAQGIRDGKPLHAPIEDAHISTQLCHLGQLALDHGGSLLTDPSNGHILDNARAQQAWGRLYEPGWAPSL